MRFFLATTILGLTIAAGAEASSFVAPAASLTGNGGSILTAPQPSAHAVSVLSGQEPEAVTLSPSILAIGEPESRQTAAPAPVDREDIPTIIRGGISGPQFPVSAQPDASELPTAKMAAEDAPSSDHAHRDDDEAGIEPPPPAEPLAIVPPPVVPSQVRPPAFVRP